MSSSPDYFVSNQDRIWSHYQTENPDSFRDAWPRLESLVREIGAKVPGKPRVLNIGTGDGHLERTVAKRGWPSYSLDPDPATIDRIREHGVNGEVGYIEAMPFADESFDAVVASEVLEHLSDEQIRAGVREIRRVLRPGGWFVGTVPYRENLADSLVVCPDCGKRFHRWGHLQTWDEEKMARIFDGELTFSKAAPRLYPSWAGQNWKGRVLTAAKVTLFHLGSHGSNERLYFEARRA